MAVSPLSFLFPGDASGRRVSDVGRWSVYSFAMAGEDFCYLEGDGWVVGWFLRRSVWFGEDLCCVF
jgi:hypothetical protein